MSSKDGMEGTTPQLQPPSPDDVPPPLPTSTASNLNSIAPADDALAVPNKVHEPAASCLGAPVGVVSNGGGEVVGDNGGIRDTSTATSPMAAADDASTPSTSTETAVAANRAGFAAVAPSCNAAGLPDAQTLQKPPTTRINTCQNCGMTGV